VGETWKEGGLRVRVGVRGGEGASVSEMSPTSVMSSQIGKSRRRAAVLRERCLFGRCRGGAERERGLDLEVGVDTGFILVGD
jgi:hypothetical protein